MLEYMADSHESPQFDQTNSRLGVLQEWLSASMKRTLRIAFAARGVVVCATEHWAVSWVTFGSSASGASVCNSYPGDVGGGANLSRWNDSYFGPWMTGYYSAWQFEFHHSHSPHGIPLAAIEV